ncbi:MAG: hypothetical protein HYZ28_27190 [Myxococcales bacterium]|nr:hypothetical protein [Myxococcales bacterium]
MRASPPFLPAGLALLAACGPAPGDFGSPCTSDGDCKTGSCFTGFAGGYCSQRCEAQACAESTRCAALQNGSFCLQSCTTSLLDCRSGYHCADVSAGSVCFPDCNTDGDCGPGARCVDQRCESGAAGAIGAACLLNAGCQSGRCEIAFNGGYCTQPCAQDGPGSFGKQCPSSAVCAKVSEALGLCHSTCTSDAQCRQEYYCEVAGASGACRSRCRGAANCALGFTCNRQDGRCIEGSALPRKTGAACRSDGDCDSAYCLDEPNQQFPKGICSADCTGNASACGTDGLCIVPSDPSFASVCLQRCQSNFDCRSDYFCSGVVNSSSRVCIPRCTAVPMCNAPEVCDNYSGDCVPPGTSGAITVERVAIGQMPISGAQSQKEFSLSVPPGVISYTIVMKGGVGGTSAISRLVSPSGVLLFDLDNYLTSQVRILPVNDGDFGMLFPNSPRVPLETGTYRFTIVNEDGSGQGEVFALLKRSTTGWVSSGKLNVNFWFAGLSVNASNAPGDPKLQEAIAEIKRIYATSGVTVGTISYFDVPAAQAANFAVIDTIDGKDSELRHLFELSAGAPNTALNFFMVKEIKGGGFGYTILGIAGGIPGIPFVQGTNASGVAVTALNLSQSPASVARTMAHEGGHWLGLWHTSEQSGQLHDPLSDTPECPASYDANKDKVVTSSECKGTGAENLMFWEAGPTASSLSYNQGYVLLRNPVVSSQ